MVQISTVYIERTHTQLGSLQVSENGNRVTVLFLHLADDVEQFLLLLLRSVAEVETKDVGTRQKQLFNHFLGTRSGPERGDLLGRLAPALGDAGGRGDGRRERGRDGAAVLGAGTDRRLKEGLVLFRLGFDKGARRRRHKGDRHGRERGCEEEKLHGDDGSVVDGEKCETICPVLCCLKDG